LVELAVAVAVLAVLAGMLVPLLSGLAEDARRTAAASTLIAVRDAIVGTADHPGFADDVGRPPATIAELLVNPFAPGDPLSRFDRDTGLGWRGPYVTGAGATYRVLPAAGFTADYGADGDPGLADPWGRPVVLQHPTAGSAADRTEFARLVTAGPDGILQTPADALTPDGRPWPDPSLRGDDVVVFLRRPDMRP
jgi:type II secretory pathway pseudopilin PulG